MNARRSTTGGLLLLACCAGLALLLRDRGESAASDPIVLSTDPPSIAPSREAVVESALESSSRSVVPIVGPVSEPPLRSTADSRAPIPAPRQPSVHGRVLGPEGHVLGDTRIGVSARGAAGRPGFTSVDGAGRFELYDLAPGVWWIAASGPGRKEASRSIVLASGAPPVEVELVLERTPSVRIHVVAPDGRPLTKVLHEQGAGPMYWRFAVLATMEPVEGSFLPLTMSRESIDAIGRYTGHSTGSDLAASCIGELELYQDPPLHLNLVLHRGVLASQLLPVWREDVTFELDPDAILRSRSGLRFRLVDRANGNPLRDVRVMLESDDVIGGSSPLLASESDGAVEFVPGPPGPRFLSIEHPGFETVHREIVLPAGEILDLGIIGLEKGTPVRVRVRGKEHLESVVVYCRELAELRGERRSSGFLSGIHPDLQGEYEVRPGEGECVVWAQEREAPFLRSAFTILRADQAGTIVELELVELVPLVVQPARSDAPRTLEVRDGLDILVDRAREVRSVPMRYDLVPGRYRLFVGRPDGTRDEREIELGPTELEVLLD